MSVTVECQTETEPNSSNYASTADAIIASSSAEVETLKTTLAEYNVKARAVLKAAKALLGEREKSEAEDSLNDRRINSQLVSAIAKIESGLKQCADEVAFVRVLKDSVDNVLGVHPVIWYLPAEEQRKKNAELKKQNDVTAARLTAEFSKVVEEQSEKEKKLREVQEKNATEKRNRQEMIDKLTKKYEDVLAENKKKEEELKKSKFPTEEDVAVYQRAVDEQEAVLRQLEKEAKRYPEEKDISPLAEQIEDLRVRCRSKEAELAHLQREIDAERLRSEREPFMERDALQRKLNAARLKHTELRRLQKEKEEKLDGLMETIEEQQREGNLEKRNSDITAIAEQCRNMKETVRANLKQMVEFCSDLEAHGHCDKFDFPRQETWTTEVMAGILKQLVADFGVTRVKLEQEKLNIEKLSAALPTIEETLKEKHEMEQALEDQKSKLVVELSTVVKEKSDRIEELKRLLSASGVATKDTPVSTPAARSKQEPVAVPNLTETESIFDRVERMVASRTSQKEPTAPAQQRRTPAPSRDGEVTVTSATLPLPPNVKYDPSMPRAVRRGPLAQGSGTSASRTGSGSEHEQSSHKAATSHSHIPATRDPRTSAQSSRKHSSTAKSSGKSDRAHTSSPAGASGVRYCDPHHESRGEKRGRGGVGSNDPRYLERERRSAKKAKKADILPSLLNLKVSHPAQRHNVRR